MIKQIQLLGLLIFIISCNEKNLNNNKDLQFDTGYVDSNRVYNNETFNLKFKIPENYYFLENTNIGIGRPCYLIQSFSDRNEKRLFLKKLKSINERFISYEDLNSLIH